MTALAVTGAPCAHCNTAESVCRNSADRTDLTCCPECDHPTCLDEREGGCSGTVEYRFPLSATGKSFPRCDGHWSKRLDVQAEIDRKYPDSPFPPSDFDPLYAGESWDEE